jgi:hypothetical protein
LRSFFPVGKVEPRTNKGHINTEGIKDDLGCVVHSRTRLSKPRKKHRITKAIKNA